MERLYASCGWRGRLAEEGAAFMKTALSSAAVEQIAQKLQLQPYVPPPKPQAPQGQIDYKAFVKMMMMS